MIRLKVIESNFNNLFLYLGKSKKEGKDLYQLDLLNSPNFR